MPSNRLRNAAFPDEIVDTDASLAEAARLLHAGEPLLAYNAVQQGLAQAPDHLRLRQLQGLSLARSGDHRGAREILERLVADGHRDAETLGLLARTYKDCGVTAASASERRENLQAAFRIYEDAYRRSRAQDQVADAYYTGINAAALALLLDDRQGAERIARQVIELCELAARLEPAQGDPYWRTATLAEAQLIQGDVAAARGHYARAAELAGRRHGDLSSTRRQALHLLRHLGQDADWLDQVLAIPDVLVYTGHMVDAPDRSPPRLPEDFVPVLRDALHAEIERIAPIAAYGAAACGTDILCLEALVEQGSEIHIVLPFPPGEFRSASVDFAAGDWGERFERLLGAAQSVTIASDHRAAGSTATFEYANLIMTGLARLRAEVLATKLVGLAALETGAAGAPGGAASLLRNWQVYGIPARVVDIGQLRAAHRASGRPAQAPRPEPPPSSEYGGRITHEIKSMLFADAVGYSRLAEDQIPIFIEHFLGAIARLCGHSDRAPVHVETAGDGLYMVFDGAADAGHFALELRDLVRNCDWAAFGLPETFSIRIALHSGPIFCAIDPITGRPLYTGPHTSRTARIEPITPPGQVYASSAYAAVAVATGVEGLEFSYVGRTTLAKSYGALPLYHIRRRGH
jgi:tetratricopeptide (TPR) repeat protein